MPDDRNGVPPGPPSPFGRVRGTNGVHRDGPVELPTRSLPVDVAEEPVDLVAVQADDELVNALGSGAGVTYGDRGHGADPDPRRNRDERLGAMLAAWRAEIDAEPIPELIDLDSAVAAVMSGMKTDALSARRRRADRLRHLAPLAAAAAIIVATVSGVGLGSKDAMPGDALWPVQQVVNPERAESIETKLVVESRLATVRTALAAGDTETAARELQAISTEIPEVRGEEGQPQLAQEQEYLALKLAETPPGTPADLSTPPKSKPTARSTTSPAAPPPASSSSTEPSQSTTPSDPSSSEAVDPDPRARDKSKALVPVPAPGSEGPATSSGSDSPAPDVTKPPTEPKPAPEKGEGPADPSTAPAPSGGQPASGGSSTGTAPGSTPDGPTSTDTTATGATASGSVGTSVDATATATTS